MGALSLDNRAQENKAMIVTCFIEGRADRWEGICVDFDLAVNGKSFREVTSKLDTAIHDYISYVKTLPEADQKRLLNRHAPVTTILGLTFRVLVSSFLRSRKDDGNHTNAYTVPCAA